MKYKHYSPAAKVVLFINCGDGAKYVAKYLDQSGKNVAVLKSRLFVSFKDSAANVIERELGQTATEMAHSLFRELRDVDRLGVDLILVEGVPETGDGLAVMNRLSKAATEVVDGDAEEQV